VLIRWFYAIRGFFRADADRFIYQTDTSLKEIRKHYGLGSINQFPEFIAKITWN